ncbi:MAG: hypothetical protein R3282_02515 [Rhodothermales bacterium]|nr:hypothetical protein [Rhodothermales bacterium]
MCPFIMRVGRLALTAALATILAILASPALLAQHDPAHHSPYVDHADREIKSLSDEEVTQLLGGEGMGLALPAELNGYPGPKHVIELADELELSTEQRQATQDIFDRLKSSAVELGKKIVHLEKELDAAFANHSISPESLESMTSEIGSLKGLLRATHLRAHLEQTDVLNPAQRHRYVELRGYGKS